MPQVIETQDGKQHLQPHITEFFQYQLEEWSWSKIAWSAVLSGTVALGLLASLPRTEHWQKAFTSALGLSILSVATTASARGVDRSRRVKDIRDTSDQGYAQFLFENMVNPDKEQIVIQELDKEWAPKRLFDIHSLVDPKNRTTYPHLLLLGNTGAGKTFLVEQLFRLSPAKNKIYVSPTKEEDEMNVPGMVYIGCGLKPSENGDYDAIRKFFEKSTADIKARTKMSKQQKLLLGFTECALDEIPAIALEINWSDWFLRITSMARKQGFRLWIPTTGDQVKTLGIEGSGDMRENLKYLRLGDAVYPHLQKLASSGKYPKEVLDWYERMTDNGLRVFCFEDEVGILPSWNSGTLLQPTNSPNEHHSHFPHGTVEHFTPVAPLQSLALSPPLSPEEIFTLPPGESLFRETPKTLPSEEPKTTDSTGTGAGDFLKDNDSERWDKLLAEKIPVSRIMIMTGYGGKRYDEGLRKWHRLGYPMTDKMKRRIGVE